MINITSPPSSLQAEMAILGTMIHKPNEIDLILSELSLDMFYHQENQIVFLTIKKLKEKGQEPSAVNIAEYMLTMTERDKKNLNPFLYLAELSSVALFDHEINSTIEIIKDKWAQRRVYLLNAQLSTIFNDVELTTEKCTSEIEKCLDEITNKTVKKSFEHISDNQQTFIKILTNIDNFKKGIPVEPEKVLKTGFSDIDFKLKIHPTDLMVLAARPACGKSTLILNILVNLAVKQGSPVLLFSPEMSREQIELKNLAYLSKVSRNKISQKNITECEEERISSSIVQMLDSPFFIDESSTITTTEIRARTRLFLQKISKDKRYKDKIPLIAIDYINLIKLQGKDSRNNELGNAVKDVKAIAKDFNIPVIALSQLSRKVEERMNKRPMMSDLRDSGEIEAIANIIAFLYRDEYYNPNTDKKKIAEFIIGKSRMGETGTIELFCDVSADIFGDMYKYT